MCFLKWLFNAQCTRMNPYVCVIQVLVMLQPNIDVGQLYSFPEAVNACIYRTSSFVSYFIRVSFSTVLCMLCYYSLDVGFVAWLALLCDCSQIIFGSRVINDEHNLLMIVANGYGCLEYVMSFASIIKCSTHAIVCGGDRGKTYAPSW